MKPKTSHLNLTNNIPTNLLDYIPLSTLTITNQHKGPTHPPDVHPESRCDNFHTKEEEEQNPRGRREAPVQGSTPAAKEVDI
jgi:hypothetical protein